MSKTNEEREKLGLCKNCGGEIDDKRFKNCGKCREKKNNAAKQRKEYYSSRGICPVCGHEKLYGEEKYCPECKALRVNSSHRYYQNNREHCNKLLSSSKRNRYHDRKDAGLCVRCGKRPPINGKVKCKICTLERIRYERKKRENKGITVPRSERVSYRLCYFCGKPIDYEGHRTCKSCAEKMENNLPRKRGGGNHWKNDNDLVFKK